MLKVNLFKFYLFVPLALVLIAIPIGVYSMHLSQLIKGVAIILLTIIIISHKRENIFFVLLIFTAAYIFFLGLYRDLEVSQVYEGGVRYLFPILSIIYGLLLKPYKKLVIKLILSYVIINDFFQLFNWFVQSLNNQTFNYSIFRATGFVGFFDFFGFINMTGLVLINHTKILDFKKPLKIILSIFFFVFIIWSLSLKMVIILILYLIIFNRKLLILAVLMAPLIFASKEHLLPAIKLRFNRYLLEPASTRSESYRVLKEYYKDFIFIGEGPGTFGGPISTKYHSMLYDKFNFNWYGEQAMSTTDTYYPHLFVELGILFGIIYLFICVILPIISVDKRTSTMIIVFVVVLNSIFSFAFNSITYCFFSFPLLFLISDNKYVLDTNLLLKSLLNKVRF